MLSDMPISSGGNTVIRKPDGTYHICELPPIGYGMTLQGGLIDHAIMPTKGTLERITMVTSYRPCDPLLPDTCTLTTVKAASDNEALMKQWVAYRMKVLAQRAENFANTVKPETSITEMATFAAEQSAFLSEGLHQMLCEHSRTPTGARELYLSWIQGQALETVVN
jgi:hypothetical protein